MAHKLPMNRHHRKALSILRGYLKAHRLSAENEAAIKRAIREIETGSHKDQREIRRLIDFENQTLYPDFWDDDHHPEGY